MKKIVPLIVLLNCLSMLLFGFEKRDLLLKKADLATVKTSLILNQKWVSYPNYHDRKAWDNLTSGVKEEIIRKGESALNYEWKVVKASDYLEFERSGNRDICLLYTSDAADE